MNKIGELLTKEDKIMFYSTCRRIRRQLPAIIFLTMLVMAAYYASIHIPPGWMTYLVSSAALIIMAVTALARLDDIAPEQASKRWQSRRAGLIFTIAGVGAIGLEPLAKITSHGVIDFPSWGHVLLHWGVALTWITTPNMPPWWKYMTGQASSTEKV